MTLTPTQQELNVRFAKALGWKIIEPGTDSFQNPYEQLANKEHETILAKNLPNYFAPENFHLVRAAVGELDNNEKFDFFNELINLVLVFRNSGDVVHAWNIFLAPVEHIITAYLKVKEHS